jgi:hypothetical protein
MNRVGVFYTSFVADVSFFLVDYPKKNAIPLLLTRGLKYLTLILTMNLVNQSLTQRTENPLLLPQLPYPTELRLYWHT